jgi:hypothetical protein
MYAWGGADLGDQSKRADFMLLDMYALNACIVIIAYWHL